MFVRLATYRIKADVRVEDWMEEHADTVRQAPEVHQVHFVRNLADARRIGGLYFFESRSDMDAFVSSDLFHRVVADLEARWIDPTADVRQLQFETIG